MFRFLFFGVSYAYRRSLNAKIVQQKRAILSGPFFAFPFMCTDMCTIGRQMFIPIFQKQHRREERMNRINFKAIAFISILSALALNVSAGAQDYGKSMKSGESKQTGTTATLTARLVDPEKKAKEKTATVQVTVKGIALIDPAAVKEQPRKGQGHLHYRVDDGPVIATTAPKLSFHELSPGQHRILVMLAANDHSPLGPQQTLNVTIP